MKNKVFNFFKENWLITLIMGVSLLLHLLAFNELGYDYTLKSDDMSYINSGLTFLKNGTITMHGPISAQIMPGMTFLIALVSFIFGKGKLFMIALKLLWITFGILTIYVVYSIIKLFSNKNIAAISTIFLLAADFIWMNNIILTETPYILCFSLLVYHTIKIAEKPNWKDYILIVVYYIFALFLRPNIAVYPVFLFIYLLLKKYDFKLLIKQCFIAGGVLIVVLTPWIYRNYKVFGEFIPLTYGIGNPLLLGTYQGEGYPSDEELDYTKHLDDKMSDEMKYYLENKDEKPHMSVYYSLERDKLKAEYRMSQWWKNNKISMLKSYLIIKPYYLIYNSFYWEPILGIGAGFLKIVRRIDIILFVISSVAILAEHSRFREWLFLILIYVFQVLLYAYTFAFERYAISMFFIRYIIIGIGIDLIVKRLKQLKKEV